VATDTVPVVAADEIDDALGLIVKVQPALWLTVNVWPAMLSDPEREFEVVFAATEYDTVPLPLPDAPAVIVIHDAALVADHGQPGTPVTVTDPVEAAPPTDTLVGEIEELHGEENANVFDSMLRPVPLGPIAATRASYVVPAAGHGDSSVVKSTRILPSDCAAGLPRLATCTGWVPPTT
jgi:hypothetical protein